MLKLDQHTFTNELHRDLLFLKVPDTHDVNVFCEQLLSHQMPRNLSLSSCNIKGSWLWNEHFTIVNSYLYKINKANVTKCFIDKYEWYLYKGGQLNHTKQWIPLVVSHEIHGNVPWWRVSILQRPLAGLLHFVSVICKYETLLDYWPMLCIDMKSNLLY